MIVQCAIFSKSLNPQNIENSVSDILIRIRCQAKFLTSCHARMHRVIFCIRDVNRDRVPRRTALENCTM